MEGNERRWNTTWLHQNGALRMAAANDAYEKASLENICRTSMAHEVVSAADGRRHWPQMNWDGLTWGVHEKEAGYLLARRSCQAVMEGFLAENGLYVQASVQPGELAAFPADIYVFACGPWLGELFPDVLGTVITPTRQETFTSVRRPATRGSTMIASQLGLTTAPCISMASRATSGADSRWLKTRLAKRSTPRTVNAR
jgi:hypothetical protein